MGSAFPEDYEIKASRLVRLWVAEGFVKLSNGGNKSLEEEAEDYIDALVQRNLVLVTQNKCNGKGKKFTIHDLLRDLCIGKGLEEKFIEMASRSSREATFFNPRRVSVGTPQAMKNVVALAQRMPGARSVVSTGPVWHEINMSPLFSSLKLLRVLDIFEKNVGEFPAEILQLVNLRYLAVSCEWSIPSGISRLCHLQTLIANLMYAGCLPWEIWEMSELRHLELNEAVWFEDESRKKSVLHKLQFLESIPNIKKLGIFAESRLISVDLSHLRKLETLTCDFGIAKYSLYLRGLPSSLRKLTLYGGDMTRLKSDDHVSGFRTLCKLPNLEVLTVRGCEFETVLITKEWRTVMKEWELAKGDEFGSLKYLLLEDLGLVRWIADETNFPVLRHLVVRRCNRLKEIPSGIGGIPTLKLMEMHGCSDSAAASVRKIQEEQRSDYDDYHLQLRIS